jgi:hypothetical protein
LVYALVPHRENRVEIYYFQKIKGNVQLLDFDATPPRACVCAIAELVRI